MLPSTSVTLCPVPKSYRLELQVGKCKGTPFSTKNKGLLCQFNLSEDRRCRTEELWHIKPYQRQHKPFYCISRISNTPRNHLTLEQPWQCSVLAAKGIWGGPALHREESHHLKKLKTSKALLIWAHTGTLSHIMALWVGWDQLHDQSLVLWETLACPGHPRL